MSNNATGPDPAATPDLSDILPPYLNLPAHLSAHKYFFVCTLTVAAWDTLVLSPRTWRLMRSHEWPLLKILFTFLRIFMPVEFTIVGVAFFDTKWSQDQCSRFFLFEPICTAVLLAACSLVHVIRIHAIYEKKRSILAIMGGLLGAQVVVTAICCGFFRSTPLLEGQGCIAEPKANWVGIYWLSATLLYTASFALALQRSLQSLKVKQLTYWKLMLRDGLNLYGAIWAVNMVNMLFWFIITPTGPEDPVRTIVTSMAAVLTASMTMRIVLSVRGSLKQGGSFAGSSSSSHPASRSTGGAHSHSLQGGAQPSTFQVGLGRAATDSAPAVAPKAARDWDGKSVGADADSDKEGVYAIDGPRGPAPPTGVKVTVESESDFGAYPREKL